MPSSRSPEPTPAPHVRSGVALNVLASALFAAMYAYTTLLQPLTSQQVFGWRMLLTTPCLALIIVAVGRWHEVRKLLAQCRTHRGFVPQRLLSSALLGVQLWLFMWAPLNGHGLDVALGYFLLPITMVLLGRMAFRDRISGLQTAALVCAVVGVACQLVIARTLSWPALLVCLGYPGYFWLRRTTDTNTLGALLLDMVLMLPVSLYFVLAAGAIPAGASTALPWLILGLGLISASALGCQALSAPRLNLTLFGLLIYVEPMLLVVASALLGERIPPAQWPTYGAIWVAVMLLVLEGAQTLARQRRA